MVRPVDVFDEPAGTGHKPPVFDPPDGLAGWPAETQRLLGGNEGGVPCNCFANNWFIRTQQG